jgi:branched-chain amino acid transport system permease protein
MLMVMFAPGGLASLIMLQFHLIAHKRMGRMAPHYLFAGACSLLLFIALILTVEMTYKVAVDNAGGTEMQLFGFDFDASTAAPWIVAVALWIVGGLTFNIASKRVGGTWDAIQSELLAAKA